MRAIPLVFDEVKLAIYVSENAELYYLIAREETFAINASRISYMFFSLEISQLKIQ